MGTSRSLLGFAALAALLAVDFHLDVRSRDALSWMDPSQYYGFALAVLEGRESPLAFEVPTIFPFFLLPALAVQASIPSALWVQFAATLLLFVAVHRLCRILEVGTPAPLVALLVVSSPLLLGLSRSLYIEYTLCAIVALAVAAWLRLEAQPSRGTALRFAGWVALGALTKTTFALFLLLPVAAGVVGRFVRQRDRDAGLLAGAFAVPLLLVLAAQQALLPRSTGYLLSLGNTAIPIMARIGPAETLSAAGLTYYPGEIGRSLLFLLTPGLALAIFALWRSRGRPDARRLTLWLWLLGAPLLLLVPAAKEPRHIAPCMVPAVLLVVMGIEGLPSRTWGRALLLAAVAAAVVQYGAVALHRVDAPYFMDRGLRLGEIEDAMERAAPATAARRTPAALRPLHRRYLRSLAITGFPPNEALALTWDAFPGVVYDLDLFEAPASAWGGSAYERFEDLYVLSAFNAYNRRCGYRHYETTLDREAVIANADFVIAGPRAEGDLRARFPGHTPAGEIELAGGRVRVLRATRPRTSYRVLYARRFLEKDPALESGERRVVARSLVLEAALAGARDRLDALGREFPELAAPGAGDRNIYWIGGYPALLALAQARLDAAP